MHPRFTSWPLKFRNPFPQSTALVRLQIQTADTH